MNSITLTLDSRDNRPLYEQIYEYIKQEIRTGKLLYDEKLPSTRSLAEYLQVSRSTVDLAYEQLAAEGYIEARPYRGYFVCHMEELYHLPERENDEEISQEEQEKRFFVDFSTNAVDLREFPFDTWRRVYRKVFGIGGEKLFLPGAGQGDRELRMMLCRYLRSSRGVDCEPEQIIVGAGNDYLLMLLDKVLTTAEPERADSAQGENPEQRAATEQRAASGRKIALENPTYKKAGRLFASMGYEICPVEMDQYGMRSDALEACGAKLAYVMPSHQFPTGTVMPIGRRMELLKWAAKKPGRYLIEDDYDSEFRYKGKPIPALQASDTQGSVIYIGTFSKSISPAIRVSYLVLPPVLMRYFQASCSYLASTVQRTEQAVLAEFIRGGYFERHLNRMRKVYRDKHDRMLELLKPFECEFAIRGENAGLHLLLQDKRGRSEKELIESAAEHGIRVYGMEELRIGSNWCTEDKGVTTGKGTECASAADNQNGSSNAATILLGYGGLSIEEMEKGIQILAQLWL